MAKDDRNAPGGRDKTRDEIDERGMGSADDVRGVAGDEGDEEFEDADELDDEDAEEEDEDEGVR